MKCTAKCYMSPHMSMGQHKTNCALDGQIIKERFCVACAGGSVPDCGICDEKGFFVPEEAVLFDITKHEWSDKDITGAKGGSDWLHINLSSYCLKTGAQLNKEDTIALAKHFKLTAEDLS